MALVQETQYYPGYTHVPDSTPVDEAGEDTLVAFTDEAGLLPSESPVPSSLHNINVETPEPVPSSMLQPPTDAHKFTSLPQLSITPSAFSPPTKANKDAMLDDPTLIYVMACISIVIPVVGLLALLCFAMCCRLKPRQRIASYVLILAVLIGLAVDATIGYYWKIR